MHNRPTLPPMAYHLWVPAFGTYVQGMSQYNRQFIGTSNRATALQLPQPQAVAQARNLIRRMGQVIELRPVDRTQSSEADGAQ